MDRTEYKRLYNQKLPCKYDPSNEGIGCRMPRYCSFCGWNPNVKKRRDERIHQKLMGAKCHG